jgi:signal transduction histidine kinase
MSGPLAPTERESQPIDPGASCEHGATANGRQLTALAVLAMSPPGRDVAQTLAGACALVRDALGAEEAYVVRAGDPHFLRVDEAGDPTAYEIKQRGYFLIWRELASDAGQVAGLFDTVDRLATNPHILSAKTPATHLAMLLPSDESSSELLLVRGPWPRGLTQARIEFLTAARPMLAHLLGALLDVARRERHREQLQSLSLVAGALTGGDEAGDALPAIATTLAKASGFDWVTLTLVDESIERITARAGNQARHSQTETATVLREADVMRARMLALARHLAASRRPLLYPDLFAADLELPFNETVRRYYERAHLLSAASFPLWSADRFLGSVSFSASTSHVLDADEVEFLALLAAQTAMAIEWLQLHAKIRALNSELQTTVAALREKADEQDAFLYTVSHDLKAPLVSIQGMALLLGEDERELSADQQHGLRRIRSNVEQMRMLLDDLLTLSRIGRTDNDTEPVPLTSIVEEALQHVDASLRGRDALVVCDQPLPSVCGNKSRLVELFQNLLDNAIKYTPRDRRPELRIGAESHEQGVECWVQDNGVGIPPDQRGRVFGLFQRLSEGKRLHPDGTGAGLAIVARIVQTHGGRIWIEDAPGGGGGGSVFRFTLPAA